MKISEYDFVCIGGGPGGLQAAIQAAKYGLRVAIVDRRPQIGGIATHATIPSKTLREAVLHQTGARQRAYESTQQAPITDVDFDELLNRVSVVRDQEVLSIERELIRHNITTIHGQGKFEDANTILVSTEKKGVVEKINVTKTIVIAAGTVPRRPDDITFDQEVIYDSNFIFSSKNKNNILPKSMIVVGAGVIGTEYACMFASLGCDVTLVDRRKEMFRFLDLDIYDQLLVSLSKSGIRIELIETLGEISKTSDDRARMELGDGRFVEAEALLFAMGRTPCSFTLELDNTNVELGKYGVISVNENYQTAEPHIYAVGDIIGFPALASTGAEQGRLAAHHACGETINPCPELFPFAIYTIPEISMVGKTEKELVDENVRYAVGFSFYRDLPKATIIGDSDGGIKILIDCETKKILGVHIIGDLASELLHLGAQAMQLGATIDTFVNTVFNFPTLSEIYKYAALNCLDNLHAQGYHLTDSMSGKMKSAPL